MRPLLWMSFAIAMIAGLSASPAHAQFAAEEPAPSEYPADQYGADAAEPLEAAADYGYEAPDPYAPDPYAPDPYAQDVATDPYAVDPAAGAVPAQVPAQAIGDRTVSDLAGSVLGAKGAQQAQDAATIVRDVLGAVRKKKNPQ